MMNFILGKDIAYYVRQHRGLVVLALVLAAFSSILVVIPAYLLQPFVDEGMKTGSDPVAWKVPWIAFEQGSWFSWHKTERVLVDGVSPNRLLLILTVIAVVASLCKSVTVYFSQYAAAAFSNRAVQSLRIDLFKKFVSLPLGFYHGKRSGEMIARAVADLTVLQGRIAQVLIELVQHPLTIIVFLAYLLFTNYQLTLMVFLVGPVIIGLVRLFSRKVKKHSKGVQDATAEVTADYQESLLNLKVIQGYGKEDFEVSGFRVVAERLYQKIMRWRRWDLGVGPGMDA
ncbi:MAG: ABC transporter ATP-binding protein, partial [Deltaproteobacteria bacterium]|nr:ABC transporter ATP-binding protein [Deltaproteobacteria bacterium]